MRKQLDHNRLTGGVALFVLDRLVETNRISADEVDRLAATLPDEIRRLEQRIRELRGGVPHDAGTPPRTVRKAGRRAPRSRRRGPSPNNGKALGGTFGGLIRRVPPNEQQQYKDIKTRDGISAAIAALRARK